MAECKRRPGARGGAAGDAISEVDAADPSLPVASPQASPAVQRLISHIARGREIRVQRIAALKVAYGASRFADELSPASDLRGGPIIVLQHLAKSRADLASLDALARFAKLEDAP